MTIDWLAGDDAIVLSAEEARAFEVFRTAEHTDYVSLVRQAGYDPARFFEHGNWQGMDLRDSDVTGVSFRSADLTEVCLYRDQYNAIRQTKPRSLDRARVQESREGGKRTSFTIEFDIARDQAQARRDFEAVWKDQVSRKEKGEIEKIDWALITGYLRRLEPPFGRIWALDEILESIDSQPPNSVYDLCTARFKLSQVLRVVGWSTVVELLQVATLRDDETRIEFLEERSKDRTYLDARVTAKALEKARELALLGPVLALYQSKGWPLPPYVTVTAASYLVRTMDGVREFLDLMTKAGVRPDTTVFSPLARCAKTMDGVREFLDLMTKAGVGPDTAVFVQLAESTKTMDGVREFLDLMTKAGVRPDTAVFGQLAQRAKTMDGVREVLDLMTKTGVRPDTTVFGELAQRAETMDGVREFLDLMTKAGVRPDHRHWTVFIGAGRTVDDVQLFLQELTALGRKPSIIHMNQLMRNAPDHLEAERVWSLIFSLGLKADFITWGTLINKMPTWTAAWDVYNSRRPAKAVITGAALGPLLRKAATRQDVRITLEEYSRRKVGLEPNSVSAVMRAPLADHDVVWALRKMKEMGLDVQAVDSAAWTEGADRFEELRKRI